MPQPKDGRIVAQLPLRLTGRRPKGLSYLAEFFDAHREGSIGRFSSGKIESFVFQDENGRTSRGLQTTIWLTPFDLGVDASTSCCEPYPGQFQDIYEVQVILGRLSGDDRTGYRMNRSFLTELRGSFCNGGR